MNTTVHVGVATAYILERTMERKRNIFIEQDGKPMPYKEAVTWLCSEIAAGHTMQSNCPSPQLDGSCPGHPKS